MTRFKYKRIFFITLFIFLFITLILILYITLILTLFITYKFLIILIFTIIFLTLRITSLIIKFFFIRIFCINNRTIINTTSSLFINKRFIILIILISRLFIRLLTIHKTLIIFVLFITIKWCFFLINLFWLISLFYFIRII